MAKVEIETEVSGNVWKIEKQVGEQVAEDEVILILESMKMEIPVEATANGVIAELLVKENDQVEEDQIVAILDVN